MSEALHYLYRPQQFDDVIGQDAAVKSLRRVIADNSSQAFLLCGPAGCGKTSLARIAAYEVGCDDRNILETNAAVNTGIDAMRAIQEAMQYRPFGKATSRAVILDEAHRLSGAAWDSLLKMTEEPPPYLFWFFCTTNPSKVPNTIKTRCAQFTVKLLKDDVLLSLLNQVAKTEKIKLPSDVMNVVMSEAQGSPRQALVNLAMCRDITSRREAAEILKSAVGSEPVLELCRFLAKGGGSWPKAMECFAKLEDENPESVRIVVSNYIAAGAKGAKTDKQAAFFLNILGAFSEPYTSSDNAAPLLLSIGQAILAGE